MLNTELLLGLVSVLTSTIAAVLGLGGGMLLIAIMPSLLPTTWIIPIHGITQLASNGSRALFAWRDVAWQFIPRFILGSVSGVAIFGLLAVSLPPEVALLTIGGYILLTLWSQAFSRFVKRYETFFSAGFFQTGLAVIVGATGPLTNTLLAKQLDSREQIVATSALMMLLSHGFKVLLFGFLGFAYLEHIWLISAMVIGAVFGSWLGTKLRRTIKDKNYVLILRIALTLLAIKMIISGILVFV